MTLNGIQLDVAREIVNMALSKAADSLSLFVRQKILLRSVDFKILRKDKQSFLSDKEADRLLCFKTMIRGDLDGNCYLILSGEEARQLMAMTLQDSLTDDPDQLKVSGIKALQEINNLITASVITQFAGFMKFDMHGQATELKEGQRPDINTGIQRENKLSNAIIHFKARLMTEHHTLEPEFIWILNSERFIKGVNRYLGKDEVPAVQFKLGLYYD